MRTDRLDCSRGRKEEYTGLLWRAFQDASEQSETWKLARFDIPSRADLSDLVT